MLIPLALQDYAYLALHVYHDRKTEIENNAFPMTLEKIYALDNTTLLAQDTWYHITTSLVNLPTESNFYANLYIKSYHQKIQHIMLAIRGTKLSNLDNDREDIKVWWRSVINDSHAAICKPDYLNNLYAFIEHAKIVIQQLHELNLVSPHCQYHATGHSLGGALANLMAATAMHYYPYTTLPLQIISFNAPGIGTMPDIYKDTIHEEHFISMRAHYDFVSSMGVPYGYVINNDVPNQYQLAKQAFTSLKINENNKKNLLPLNSPFEVFKTLLGESNTADVLSEISFSLPAQHSMNNFFKTIMKHTNIANYTFQNLKNWALNHGGFNHHEIGTELILASA